MEIEPKGLEQIPVKSAEEQFRDAIDKLDGVPIPIKPQEPKLNWSDMGNIIKNIIVSLTVQVSQGKVGLTFWATIIVVILFFMMKLFGWL